MNCQRDHRGLLLRNLATSVILFEKVKTTDAKAKQVRPIVESLITKAKTCDEQSAIRLIGAIVLDKNASKKLLEVLKPRYAKRSGGYTRIVKLGMRKGDAANMVSLQLVEEDGKVTPAKAAPNAKAEPKPKKDNA